MRDLLLIWAVWLTLILIFRMGMKLISSFWEIGLIRGFFSVGLTCYDTNSTLPDCLPTSPPTKSSARTESSTAPQSEDTVRSYVQYKANFFFLRLKKKIRYLFEDGRRGGNAGTWTARTSSPAAPGFPTARYGRHATASRSCAMDTGVGKIYVSLRLVFHIFSFCSPFYERILLPPIWTRIQRSTALSTVEAKNDIM